MILCSHPVPSHLEARITDKGGRSPNGLPLFRVIWGADRLTVIGGEWKKYDDSGNLTGTEIEEKLTVKYLNAENRWIFEVWCPPENYGTPEEWETNHTKIINGKTIRELGPYPANGEYELVKVLETPNKRAFVPLTATICDALVAVAVRNQHLPKEIRMAHYRHQQEKVKTEQVLKRAAIIDNLTPAFDGPTISVPADISREGKVIVL